MRWLFTALLAVMAEALGLFLVIKPPANDDGHVVRVGGAIIMACGVALFLGLLDARTGGRQSEER